MRNGILLALAGLGAMSSFAAAQFSPGPGMPGPGMPGPGMPPGYIGPMPRPMYGPGMVPPGYPPPPGMMPGPFGPGFVPPGMVPYPPMPLGLAPGPYSPYPSPMNPPRPMGELPSELPRRPLQPMPPQVPPQASEWTVAVPVAPQPPAHSAWPGGCAGGACAVVPECPPYPDRPAPAKAPRGYRGYGRLEALYWFVPDQSAPALVAVGPIGGEPTTVLGNGDLEIGSQQGRLGGRATLGFWLDSRNTCAIEFSYFALQDRESNFTATAGAGEQSIVRPYFDVVAKSELAAIVAGTGTPGTISITTHNHLAGADANFRKECKRFCSGHVDFLFGARFLQLNEDLTIIANSGTGFPFSTGGFVTQDVFGTQNTFWGAQVGLEGEWTFGRLYLNLWGKVAVGLNNQEVNINGFRQNPALVSFPGGLLAQPSNTGVFARDKVTTLSEACLTLGYRCNTHLRLFGGYNILYVNNVVRPGSQIDRSLNLSQGTGSFTGALRPLFEFKDSTFWAQGVTAGFEFRF